MPLARQGHEIGARTIQKSEVFRNLPAGKSEIRQKRNSSEGEIALKVPEMWLSGDLSSANVPENGLMVDGEGRGLIKDEAAGQSIRAGKCVECRGSSGRDTGEQAQKQHDQPWHV